MPVVIDDCGFQKNLQCDYRKLLGSGSYGKVYKCMHRNVRTGDVEIYALKHASTEDGIEKELQIANEMARGCGLLSETVLYTKYIIPIYNTNKRNTVALLYANVLSKYKTPEGRTKMSLSTVLHIARSLREAVLHIHDNVGIIHNDIKPDNIGLVKNEVKLLDLGLMLSKDEPIDISTGTIGYKPPKRDYATKVVVDMWAVGCTMVELVSGSALSMFFVDLPESLDIHEFAAMVIIEDLLDMLGEAIVRYVLGYADALDLSSFEQKSLMGFHAATMADQLRQVRERYAFHLKKYSDDGDPKKLAKMRSKITETIWTCFAYAFDNVVQGGGGGAIRAPMLRIPVPMRPKKHAGVQSVRKKRERF